jgi:hypothetical protein
MYEDAHDFAPLPDFSMMIAHRRHDFFEPPTAPTAMVSANAWVERASYRDAMVSPQSVDWQIAIKTKFDSLISNQTCDLVP